MEAYLVFFTVWYTTDKISGIENRMTDYPAGNQAQPVPVGYTPTTWTVCSFDAN